MKPYIHAKINVKKYGGEIEDYLPIHDFMDSSGMAHADIRHRAILHHSLGCHIVEQIFGAYATNSAGKQYSPRDIAEEHVIQDLGFLPTASHYLNNMKLEKWMSGTEKGRSKQNKAKFISLKD